VSIREVAARGAAGCLASLGLAQSAVPAPRGFAMQLRINMEVMDEKGATKPTGGTLAVFDPPSGPGVRVDTFGYAGYKTSAAFDSLLAKVIVHSPAAIWPDVVQKAARALREFRIGGVATNIPFIQAVLAHPDFAANRIATDFIDTHVAALVSATKEIVRPLFFAAGDAAGEAAPSRRAEEPAAGPAGSVPVAAPLQGTIVAIEVSEGDLVRPGQQIAILESMKMEHLVAAPHGGKVTKVTASSGATLMHGEAILFLEPAEIEGGAAEEKPPSISTISALILPISARHAITLDENRPAAVERRRMTNQRTARKTSRNWSMRARSSNTDRWRLPPSAPAQGGRSHSQYAGRRPDLRCRNGECRKIRRGCRPLHGDFL
jgi:acetyl/propionyl-CoA carboxylase alpha subunit